MALTVSVLTLALAAPLLPPTDTTPGAVLHAERGASHDTLVHAPVIASLGWQAQGGMRAAGQWAISLRAPNGREVWRAGTHAQLRPASTVKVVSAAYTLAHMNPMEGLRTRVEGRGAFTPMGHWEGQVRLVLGGDYTLERQGTGHTLQQLAASLRAMGIRTLHGPLLITGVDGRPQPGVSFPSTWDMRHRGQSYAPLVGFGAMADGIPQVTILGPTARGGTPRVQANSPGLEDLIDLRARSSAPVKRSGKWRYPTPSLQAAWEDGRLVIRGTIGVGQRRTIAPPGGVTGVWSALWADALRRAGIAHEPEHATPGGRWMLLAEARSKPVALLLRDINMRSYNLGAEQVWHYTEATSATSRDRWLAATGWPATHRRLVDGSGLSDANRVEASAFSEWWHRMLTSSIGDLLLSTLPTGGEGTLRRVPGLGEDRVRAKTGTLGTATSLVGAWRDLDGNRWSFVMLYEGKSPSAARASMYKLLSEWTTRYQPLLTMSFEDSLRRVGQSVPYGVSWGIPSTTAP